MEIQHVVSSCRSCAEHRVQHPEPLISTPTPDRPWQRLGIDLFYLKGVDYLLLVDYYSRFPEVVTLTAISSERVIAGIKSCFARFGIPEVVRTDNGPQFSSREFSEFARSYGFIHETSSPRYPRSNGEVERMVRTVKNLLQKSEDPFLALLAYRNTAGPTGFSPAQLLMGRRLNTRLPTMPGNLLPTLTDHSRFKGRDAALKARQKRIMTSVIEPVNYNPYLLGERYG